jgi:predicted transposase YdaD
MAWEAVMSKPFDATLKMLLEESPRSWSELFDFAAGVTTLVDADTSTVSGGADKVLRVSGPPDWIMHIEFQTGPDPTLPQRMSAVLLLSPKANLRRINGVHESRFRGETYRTFRYRVLRLWQVPVARLLEGAPSLLPLAPVGDVHAEQLPGVIERIKQRLRTTEASEAAGLWTAMYVLMGLRYSEELSSRLLEGVIAMEDSVTYQAIVEKGEVKGARKLLVSLLKGRLGDPSPEVLSALELLTDIKQLEAVGGRMGRLDSWEKVIQELAPRQPRKRRRS